MQIKPLKFTVEQFQDQAKWIGPFFSALNQLTGDIVLALNGKLTIQDNMYQEVKELKFKNYNLITSTLPLKFKPKYSVNPLGLSVIYLYNDTLKTYSTQAPWLTWSFNSNNEIQINSITGLTTSTSYIMRLLVIYG